LTTELEKFNEIRRLRGKAPVSASQYHDAMARAREKRTTTERGTSKLGQFARGAGDVVQGYAGLADAAARSPVAANLPGMGLMSMLARLGGGTQPLARRGVEALAGPDIQPQTQGQGYARAAGRAAAAIPATIASGGGAVLGPLSNLTGEAAGEFARQRGAGTAGQIAASVAGGVGPGLAASLGRTGLGNRVAERFSQGTRDIAAENVADAALRNQIGPDRMPAAMGALANEADEATSAARYGTRLSTPQALSRIAPGMQALEGDVERRVGTFGAEMLDDRIDNLGKLERHYRATLQQGGSAEAAGGAVRAARTQIADDVDAAFNQTSLGTDLTVAKKGLSGATATIRAEVAREGGFNARYMPDDLMAEIDDAGDSISLSALRGLEKRLTSEIFESRDVPQRVRYLSMLADEVDNAFDKAAKAGGADAESVNQLRKAIALKRREGELFNRTVKTEGQKARVPNVVVQAFERYEDPVDAVRAILRSPRPVENLTRLQSIVGDRPGAWEGVKAVVHRDAFGDNFEAIFRGANSRAGSREIDSVVTRIKANHEAYNYAMGDSRAAKNSIDFLERLRKAKTVGIAGTREATLSTRSGIAEDSVKKTALNATALLQHGVGGLRGVATSLLQLGGHSDATMAQADRLIARALRDPKFGRWFLELRPRRELPRWRDQVQGFLQPSAIRGAAAATQNEKERR
jgi:hypothetical protein